MKHRLEIHQIACVSPLMLSRFGKKKEDKSKDAMKASKSKLEALSEEELDKIPDSRDGYEHESHKVHSITEKHLPV